MSAKYKYHLPNSDGTVTTCETDSQVVVIVGANGSGKSKLGAWMEQQDQMNVHRIAAQRSLNFSENLALKSYAQAEDMVLYGTTNENDKRSKGYRWNWGKGYTTQLINDFENVLAALLALKNDENDKFISACKRADRNHVERPPTPITAVDKLRDIWHDVYPQRDLIVADSKFFAAFIQDGKEIRYNANEMSDGERAVLYFAAQILCIPKDRTLIIDEPEVHLHRSIMNRLWRLLMALRQDCLFVIITHDIDFAASIETTEKYWIKMFDGHTWEIQKIDANGVPEQLLLAVLGSRKNVLLVEGVPGSYDTRLYSRFYPDWHIVPCGGCDNVISYAKAFSHLQDLHSCRVCAIVDRDYRSDKEITALEREGVFVLPVAEVENLFLIQELLDILSSQFACDQTAVAKVKDFVINTKLKGMMAEQIRNKFVRELKYSLESLDISDIDTENNSVSLADKIQRITTSQLLANIRECYQKVLTKNDYGEALKIFNAKELVKSVGVFFGISNADYCEKILRLFAEDVASDRIRAALAKYLPDLSGIEGNVGMR